MSRTYRLRKAKSKRSKRFVDARCTRHMAQVDERFTYFIAHVIFNLPCKIVGREIVEYKKSEYYGTDTKCIDHSKCLPWRDMKFRRSIYSDNLASMLKYDVAPMWLAERKVKNNRRQRDNKGYQFDKRSNKRRQKILNQYMKKTGDVDAIRPRNSRTKTDD